MLREKIMKHPDVIIIGAGISGVSAALELAESGVRVTVIERYQMPAAMGSGWTLAGVRQSGRDPAELPLARHAINIWKTLNTRLEANTGYVQSGNIRLARNKNEFKIIRTMVDKQKSEGLSIEFLTASDIESIAPLLSSKIHGASYCASDGKADPKATVNAFKNAAERKGVKFKTGVTVENILTKKMTFEEALKKHSKRTPVSDALNGWWLRGDFSSIFPKNPALEKKLFSLSVGEVLNPVTTRLGFHLFLLEDRAGEKIKIKQIFIPLQEISIDLTPTIKEHESLLLSCDNDPGLFDSLAIANKNFYIGSGIENYSGVFNSISFDINMLKENPFYKELEKKLKTINDESFSKPFIYKNSVFSLYKYLYEEEKEITFEDLYLKWDYFESLALQTKRNVYIEEWINVKKRDFYVKIY